MRAISSPEPPAEWGGIWLLRRYVNQGSDFLHEQSDGSWVCRLNSSDGRTVPLRDPIIIVGSDGSGTRAVAKFLSQLDIIVLVEQSVQHQLDVDGAKAGVHFTAAIQQVLGLTKSPNYRLPELPSTLVEKIRHSVIDDFSFNMRSNACEAYRTLWRKSTPSSDLATSPSPTTLLPGAWAFKKPDLLNLLPFLLAAFPHMKILHVVRDGRDMAFSKNHAPLKKYAMSLLDSPHGNKDATAISVPETLSSISNPRGTLPNPQVFKTLNEAEKQISIWNIQNLAVASWGRSHSANYLWMRVEDLSLCCENSSKISSRKVDTAIEGSNVRKLAIMIHKVLWNTDSADATKPETSVLNELEIRVANVLKELEKTQLGSHDKSTLVKIASIQNTNDGIRSRYGKWHTLANARQIESLSRLGRGGLEYFGYVAASRWR